MKNSVIYYTKLGHSRKIAEAIAQELHIKAEDIHTHPDLNNLDLLFIVSGIYGGKKAPELLEQIKTLDSQQVKQVALITSSGGKTTPATDVRAALLERGIQVIKEEFTCQGAIFFFGLGHPNKIDLQNAVAFAKTTLQQTKQS